LRSPQWGDLEEREGNRGDPDRREEAEKAGKGEKSAEEEERKGKKM
jgi:hypothetical protein